MRLVDLSSSEGMPPRSSHGVGPHARHLQGNMAIIGNGLHVGNPTKAWPEPVVAEAAPGRPEGGLQLGPADDPHRELPLARLAQCGVGQVVHCRDPLCQITGDKKKEKLHRYARNTHRCLDSWSCPLSQHAHNFMHQGKGISHIQLV